MVLCLFAANDVMGDYYGDRESVDVKYGYRLPKDRWLATALVDFLRTHSYGWMLAVREANKGQRKERNKQFVRLAATRTREVLRPTLDVLTEFNDCCDRSGVKFGVVMIPAVSGYTPFDQPLKRFFERRGIHFLDLGDSGFEAKHSFQKDGHWNERGHRKAARHIASFCFDLLEEAD